MTKHLFTILINTWNVLLINGDGQRLGAGGSSCNTQSSCE